MKMFKIDIMTALVLLVVLGLIVTLTTQAAV